MTTQRSIHPARQPLVFALGASRALGQGVARALGVALADCEEREFEDGEHKVRPLADVHGADVFVVHSLYGDGEQSANDKLCRLLFFLGALRDAGAARLTAVVPYLCYSRKDRRTKPHDPVTTRYVATLFEAVGADVVMTLDVHNIAAFENAFRCATAHVEAFPLFAAQLAPLLRGVDVAIVSPDEGGLKRADGVRRTLAESLGAPVAFGFMEKIRSGGVVSGERLCAEVDGRAVIIVDDIVSTGTTLLRAAQACRRAGARSVHAVATHGIFAGEANRVLADPAIDRILVSDSIAPFRVEPAIAAHKLRVVESAPLLADAIRRLRGEAAELAIAQ